MVILYNITIHYYNAHIEALAKYQLYGVDHTYDGETNINVTVSLSVNTGLYYQKDR